MQGEIEVEEPQEGEDGEEEHSTSPRNVGHNIYILAHQVSYQLSVYSKQRQAHPSVNAGHTINIIARGDSVDLILL